MKIPIFDEQRRARVRHFLVEMDRAYSLEEKQEAVLVYMDESFVHQAHGSAYSYFLEDDKGRVQDGFGRTSGKGSRMIMVHAISKHGLLVTCDESGFPIKEGWFKTKGGRERPRADYFSINYEPTAEHTWRLTRCIPGIRSIPSDLLLSSHKILATIGYSM